MNVLVVDDQGVQRELLSAVAMAAWMGAVLHTASDLEEGLQAAQAHRMDVVLLDLGLPGCNGADAVKRFRTKFPSVPILVISSNDEGKVISDALEAGANAFIPKGLSAPAMVGLLRGPKMSH